MSRMNPTKAECQFDEGRLMQLLVAPIVSEKATMVADKGNVVTFKVLPGWGSCRCHRLS